jgi:hypothetical protein
MMDGIPPGTAGLARTASAAAVAAHGLDAVGEALARSAAGLSDALVRWWIAPWARVPDTASTRRCSSPSAAAARCSAYAAWAHGAHRASAGRCAGCSWPGGGLRHDGRLVAACASHAAVGPAVSVAGALLVLKASLLLVRERQAQRERGGDFGAPTGAPPRRPAPAPAARRNAGGTRRVVRRARTPPGEPRSRPEMPQA